jgi:hypothetical protein
MRPRRKPRDGQRKKKGQSQHFHIVLTEPGEDGAEPT